MVTNVTNQGTTNGSEAKVVAFPSRLMPLHNGHEAVLCSLAREFDKVVVILGSVFETGTEKNSILATERQKTVHAIFKQAGISKQRYEILNLADVPTFEEWILKLTNLCRKHQVTHICTGNREDILDVLEQKGENFEFPIVNPEDYTDFPYHATDIRKMIMEGDERVFDLIPKITHPIIFHSPMREIIAASQNCAVKFVQGRQTVDMIFLLRNQSDGKIYVLLGKRSMQKEDFPGYLALPGGGIEEQKGETAFQAVIREFDEETGLKLKIIDNSIEPAIVKFNNVPNPRFEQMFLVGLYSSEDPKLAGTKGGSSQCFGLFVEDEIECYREKLAPTSDLENVDFYEIHDAISKGLAYQHETMIKKAVEMFQAYPDFRKMAEAEKEEEINTLVIAFVGAPGAGKSAAAFGTAYQFKKRALSIEYVPEVAKDMLFKGLLKKYIPNQTHLISEQYTSLYNVMGQVDYIVTDAGLEISALHAANENKIVEELAWYLRRKLNQFTIFIERDEKEVSYETRGRIETEAESCLFGQKLEKYLQENGNQYQKVIGTDAAIELALEIMEKHRNGEE